MQPDTDPFGQQAATVAAQPALQPVNEQPQAHQPVVGMEMPNVGMPATSALTALVLAILGLFCGGIFLAIPGLIVANGALAITNQYPNHPDAGSAKAAQVLSWIVIGIYTTIILYFVWLIFIIRLIYSIFGENEFIMFNPELSFLLIFGIIAAVVVFIRKHRESLHQ
jgi:hypothetical protein